MINIVGAADGRIAPIISDILKEKKGQSLVVVSTLNRAKRLATDLSFFSDKKIHILPPHDETVVQYEARSSERPHEQIKAMKAAVSDNDDIIIAPATGVIRKLPPRDVFAANMIEIEQGKDVSIEDLKQSLTFMGYERVAMIEGRGEYSIRGAIIDIFTPDGEFPYRIELFDTEIDSIRGFDIETQRSVKTLKRIVICQSSQLVRDDETFEKAKKKIEAAYKKQIDKLKKKKIGDEIIDNLEKRKSMLLEYTDSMVNTHFLEQFIHYFYDEAMYIWDYMRDPHLFVDDPTRILETLEVFEKEGADDIAATISAGKGISEDFKSLSGTSDYFKIYEREGYLFTPFASTIKNAPFLKRLINVDCRAMPVFNGKLDLLKSELENRVKREYEVTIVCANEEKMKNMREFLMRENLDSKVKTVQGTITAGMDFPERKMCLIWEGDIFGGFRRGRRKKKRNKNAQIKSFTDVQKGDYVVHETHGIGKFIGIEQLVVQGTKKDYIKLKYAGEDSLYIPVDQLDMLEKYIGGGGATPKLNKLSGSEWKKTKAKARAAITDMADELIRVSALRLNEKGYAFSQDTAWQGEFEDSFPYTETDDQLKCIEEIKKDMERDVPMDRLLCGDVGFGKTEVAARALFKCVADGKQAAVLVPTTLLANQHYYNLKDRFERFPFKVEMLSRFRTAAQQTRIVEGIKNGTLDLVIGTHRLLSADIKFKNLGLLVVDEEQRFGVRHKERIKQLKENVDVLTLSATPIPRTLHMSLSGIKDMSTIEEPPADRYPVQTYVMEQDDFVIREAIEKELGRGGQVYVIHNRVESIARIARDIERLVPDASIAVGHGKMKENQLEDIIMDFSAGEYNVLVSTTIVESGMDIPNVNTMLILDADRFGLAQLYQLRGRVGRSDRVAYAYLMYRKDRSLSEIAEKRLRAIKDFTEFGSGFKIAMKDLEFRGAGNLLGTEQSGHMLNVGYELYCKMLEEAVEKAKGSKPAPTTEETTFSLPVTAVISKEYIDDDVLRLQMYKKIATISDDEDEADIVDELTDRFGDIPAETMNLIKISKIRSMAEALCVKEILRRGYKVLFTLRETAKLKPEIMAPLAETYGEKMMINVGKEPFIRLTTGKEDILKSIENFLQTAVAAGK